MRELYNTIPEKPEWLTAEDIDRYAERMRAGALETIFPKDRNTVMAQEATLMEKLMADDCHSGLRPKAH